MRRLLPALALLAACSSSPRDSAPDFGPPIPAIDTSASPNGVVPLPDDVNPVLRELFVKYTKLVAPNGGPIHFLAQSGVSDEKLVRAREVMRFYLTDAPGTRFGADKSAVANAMAERRATLVYFDTEEDSYRAGDGLLPELPLFYQDLYAEESLVEGDEDYRENRVRDATLEEVFHLVHGAGIRYALPEYHAEIEAAAREAVRGRSWFTNTEWVFEGSSPFEYVISVIDVFYGLWAHDPHDTGESFHGEYVFVDREGIEEGDVAGVEVLRMFLPDELSFRATLDPEFDGTFSLAFDPALPYTHKSRWLVDVGASGSNDVSLVGNDRDNVFRPNAGTNAIDGAGGFDVVELRGARAEYEALVLDDLTHVFTDSVEGRDGEVTLTNVECVHFADEELPIAYIVCRGRKELALSEPDPDAEPWDESMPQPEEWDLEEHMATVVDELLELFDENGDGGLSEDEVEGDFVVFFGLADADVDGIATRDEIVRSVESAFTPPPRLRPEDHVAAAFASFDADRDGRLVLEELPPELHEGFAEVDANGDGAITPEEMLPAFR